ncbi:hypothetical protein O9K51_09219 [Purpureocillium lavendulum]|uniref:Uncharacterized protein n=1 Tax=Purpureocillium lavendulum TaxID=1247861 RepID=A0AB34FGU3_9HYPO|nr:hypothetical protein O9K51_09219 [Purpureocillium lavendulum]
MSRPREKSQTRATRDRRCGKAVESSTWKRYRRSLRTIVEYPQVKVDSQDKSQRKESRNAEQGVEVVG